MEGRGRDSLCGALHGDAGDGHHGGDLVEEEDFAKKIRCGMENRKNTEYISLLSVISAFSVVSLHTNGCFWKFSTARYWLKANIIESVYYFAVPIFFMISGATLIDYPKRYDGWTYAKKRVHRTVIPFLAWSLIGWAIPLLHLLYRGRPVAPELLSVSGMES